ncbi:MAG: S-layer homology domain-containing protein [Nodosilinea sp.]
MSIVATQSLLGQAPAVVQSYLGPAQHHQPNPDNQTDLYVYGASYLRGLFPVQTTGIIGIYRSNLCIALKIIFSKVDPRYDHFIYNREIASRLFERVIGNDYAYWHEVEAEPRANNTMHYVYCMGHRIATTWDASALDHTLASDVSIFLDNRCGPSDQADLTQPLIAPPSTSAGQAFRRPQGAGLAKPTPGLVQAAAPDSFSDISGNPYQADILKAVTTYGLVAGYPDGTYRPAEGVTRDQGLTMLVNAIEQMIVSRGAITIPAAVATAPFADVPPSHKSAPQFYFAQQVGIIFGDDDQKVYPDAPLSRAELMAMVHNGLQVVVEANYGPQTAPIDVIEPVATGVAFSDLAGHWGEPMVRALAAYGIASPRPESATTFNPDAVARRDYTAAVLVRLVEVPRAGVPGATPRLGQASVFSDIGHDPYKEDIIRAANQYGLATGYDDQTFHPTEAVSREQAVAMLVTALQILVTDREALQLPAALSDPPPFEDVTAGRNAIKIQFAKQAGLVSGDPDGYFRPLDKLSRGQLMAMIHRGLEFLVKANVGQDIPLTEAIKAPRRSPPGFTDIPAGHPGHDMLSALGQVGIATPYNETGTAFQPDLPARRNFATAAMVRLVETQFAQTRVAQPPQPTLFTDLKGSPYAAEIGRAATQYKLVAGYEDGSFKPRSPVSREQAVAMLVDALKHRVVNKDAVVIPDHLTQPPFADVDLNRWSASRLYLAKQAGMIAGDPQGRFNPEAPLSRAQLIAMAHQTLQYAARVDGGKPNQPIEQLIAADPNQPYTFDDLSSDHWAAAMINAMGTVGLARPLDADAPTRFAPDTPAYRDYAVATAVHLIEAPYAQPGVAPGQGKFVDLADSPYSAEIQRAVDQYQLVTTQGDDRFYPAESISREQVAAMVVAALKAMAKAPDAITLPDSITQDPFRDVPVSSRFAPQIKAVAEAGLLGGDPSTGLFHPKNDLTRAELMTVMAQALTVAVSQNPGAQPNPSATAPPGPTFTDIDTHGAQAEIEQMATLGIALPQPPSGHEFSPDLPARRDFATMAMVRLIEAV